MTKTEAKKYLKRACKRGYVPYHTGLCCTENQWGKPNNWGINIDGDGREGRYFGCPDIIWDIAEAQRRF